MKVLMMVAATAAMGTLALGPTEWHATLAPAGGSGISGSAGLEMVSEAAAGLDTPARYRVGITVLGGKPGARHGWRVRSGRCGETGATLGAIGVFGPIAIDDRGGGTSSTEISATIADRRAYAVDVHAVGASDVVACGELTPR